MDMGAADLDLLMRALVHYRQHGCAADVLDLLGRLHREIHRRRVVAAELGPPTGERALVPLPGGRGRDNA